MVRPIDPTEPTDQATEVAPFKTVVDRNGKTVPLEGLDRTPLEPGGELIYVAGRTQWQMFWLRFKRHRLALISSIVLVLLVLIAIVGPIVSPYKFDRIEYTGAQAPSVQHPFGTDELGRDELTRLMYGGRVSLSVGLIVAVMSASIGTLVGMIAGYYGGRIDNFLMRFTDMVLALPLLPLLMVAGLVFSDLKWDSLLIIPLILGLLEWMAVARLVRGSFLALREKEFVEAAHAMGASDWRIITKHLLPNSIAPIVVNTTLVVGAAIIVESVLSFLGFGIQPPTPSWGNMLSNARSTMITFPWLMWAPGAAIVLTVLSVNFLGDGLRDALDPTQVRVRE
jgi:peptide/nickel transport system permease protein